MALVEYGGMVSIPDLDMRNEKVFGPPRKDIDKRIYEAYALGAMRSQKSDSIDWVINHPNLNVKIQRNESLRSTEVSFIVTYDDEKETPPTDGYKAREGYPLRHV